MNISWLEIFKRLLLAVYYFVRLKSDSFYYDIHAKHLNKIKDYRDEIEKLRDSGGSDNAFRADKLRKLIAEEEKFFMDISTAYLALRTRYSDPDERGEVQSPK